MNVASTNKNIPSTSQFSVSNAEHAKKADSKVINSKFFMPLFKNRLSFLKVFTEMQKEVNLYAPVGIEYLIDQGDGML